MLVFLPAPILLAAGIVELPIERYPNFAGITAILGIVVISYLWQPAFRITNTPFGIASTSIVPALDSIPLDKTIATQKDISMIHTYLYFMKTGKLPSLNDFNIVSLHSNRFYPKEMRNNPKFLFKDIDACYRETLTFTEKKPVPWNSYLDPDFFTEKRVLALKQTINDLIYTDGYRHFIFYIIKSPNHPYDFLNKQTIRAMESILEQDHKLRAVETDYDGAPGCLIRSFRIIDIELPAEDGGK